MGDVIAMWGDEFEAEQHEPDAPYPHEVEHRAMVRDPYSLYRYLALCRQLRNLMEPF